MKKKLFAIATILLLAAQSAFAWGGIGHKAIVQIAENHLTDKAKQNIAKYFDYDLKKDASYMDAHRNDEDIAYTTAWHVYNVDENHEYDPNPRAHKGDCFLALLYTDYNLRDGKWQAATDSAVVMNVRMLIHFVGDFHCPTHSYLPGPRCFWPCELNGEKIATFHGLYDAAPKLLHPGMNAEKIAALLDTCSESEIRNICSGSYLDWAKECGDNNALIYEINPFNTPVLDPDTLEKSRVLVDTQLRNAGYRLAFLLNKYFGE